VGIGGIAWLERMGRLGVMPPIVSRKGLRKAGVLDRVALQALADEGKTPALAAKTEGD
jgi:hypothetical protein